ncbi:MAG: DUF2844 domain-containing protein [Nitrospirae bacterium]|nr:DUF2844 domain-containing protein [Nitrospirota bacterium]
MRRFALFIVFAILAVVLLPSPLVNAAIGGSIDSVESDRKALSAPNSSVPQMVFDGYTVAEINSGASAIREYISPDGVVFAVVWNGPVHPDLTPLLGYYNDEYVNALRQTPRMHGKRHSRVKTPSGLVVERWGHMRSVRGRAYVPELIPSGAGVDDIK